MTLATFNSPTITLSVTGGVPQDLIRTNHGTVINTTGISILNDNTASRQMGYLFAASGINIKKSGENFRIQPIKF